MGVTAGRVVVSAKADRVDVVLDRPAKLNALDQDLLGQLESAFAELPEDARVVVLSSSSPRAFCVGADLHEHRGQDPGEAFAISMLGNRALQAVASAPVPVLARIDGWCLGGGLELALACDIRLASTTAVLGFPEVSLGNTPAWGGVPRLLDLVGPGRAKSLLLSARQVDANEALTLRLVEHVHPAEELAAAVDALAATISGHPPYAVRTAKALAAGSTAGNTTVLDALGAGFFLAHQRSEYPTSVPDASEGRA